MTKEELGRKALEARSMAYVPYSRFPVGAALECEDGTVYTGCNVENASYGAANCAERTAVYKAVSEGRRRFRRIAVAGSGGTLCPPCGICRQVLSEFAPDLEVLLVSGSGETAELNLRDLLPYSFGGDNLK